MRSLLHRYFGFTNGSKSAGDLIYFLRRTPWQDIKDEQLKKALMVIHELADMYNATVDIHDGNVMWRLTVGGPQLVIVDPLFAGWHTLKRPSYDQNFY